jgi:hypothetical protein
MTYIYCPRRRNKARVPVAVCLECPRKKRCDAYQEYKLDKELAELREQLKEVA